MSETPEKDLVFIASGGRTGTQFFGDMLKTVIADCWSEHEPDTVYGLDRLTLQHMRRFGLWHTLIGRALGVAGVRALGHGLLTGRLSEEKCFRRLRRSRLRYHASIPQRLVIESHGRWWMFAGRIHRIWPGAKTVCVIRDPRDWVESWRRHHAVRHARAHLHWFPLGALTPLAVGDAAWVDRWETLGTPGRLAWEWRFIYGLLDRAAANSSLVRIYRFEDLFSGDDSTVRELVHFAAEHGARSYPVGDMTGFTDTVRNASHGQRSSWHAWSSADARLVDELCGPLMRRYGYGTEAAWQAMLRDEREPADRNSYRTS